MVKPSAVNRIKAYAKACLFLSIFCAGMVMQSWPAQAITLTPEQMRLAQQLSPQEKARLAASAGLKPRESGTESVDSRYETQLQEMKPEKPEPVSAMERDFNQRLLGEEAGRNQNAEGPDENSDGDAAEIPAEKTPEEAVAEKADFAPSDEEQELRNILVEKVGENSRKIGGELKQFGYDLFASSPTTFAPVTDIPIPPEYVLGPGDELKLQYYGSRNDSLTLIVDREGVVELPEIGTISVAGLSFQETKALLSQNIHEKLIGVNVSVSMGRLRSIRVFVLGDVRHPGSYLVSGVSTMSNALFVAGGVSKKGSLRHIYLKRKGQVKGQLDLYDFLLHGDSSKDQRLMPGDVIFVPPVGKLVAVAGEVVRPAIYELRNEHNVKQILALAGGVTATADIAHAQIERLDGKQGATRFDLDLRHRAGQSMRVRNGDLLMLYRIPDVHHNMVTLQGQVKRPGDYGFHKGMTLGSLIRSKEDLLKDAYLDYVLIQRTMPDRSLKVLRIPLRPLLQKGGKKADVALQDEDKIVVLAKSAIEPMAQVYVGGEVVSPGRFPLTSGMRLLDLLMAAGGPTERAYLKQVEITRYQVIDGEKRHSKHFVIDLKRAMAGDDEANILLQPYDVLNIRRISNWRNVEVVEVRGEVRFPGRYPIEEGERLSSLIERAGGYTHDAYLGAAVFSRASLREEQQKKLDEIARQLEGEIARLETQSATLTDPKAVAQRQASIESAKKILQQTQEAKATGRLVIQLRDLQAMKGTSFDIGLKDGDSLYIPKRPDAVLVMGQVYNNTALVYQEHLDVDDYINRAGGPTRLADEDHIYIVHASGIVEPVKGGWSRTKVLPGDAIVVPESLEQFNALQSALDWSKVLYQVGVALASMKTIGIL